MAARDRSEPRFIVRLLPPNSAGGGDAMTGARYALQLLAMIINLLRSLQLTGGPPSAIVQVVDLCKKGAATNITPVFKDVGQALAGAASGGTKIGPVTIAQLLGIMVRAAADVAPKVKSASTPTPQPKQDELDLTSAITSFEFEESEKKNDILKLAVDNSDLRWFDTPLCAKGTRLLVTWGYAGDMSPQREVVVFTVKGGRTLNVEAHGKGMLMHKKVRNRTFEGKTRAEIVRQIAKENGYDGTALDVDPTVGRYHIVQAETDAAFMRRLATLEHGEFYIDFAGLHFHKRQMKQKPTVEWQYFLPPGVGDIVDFSIENDITAKPGAVTVKGRDPLAKTDFATTADDANTPRTTLATEIEVIDIASGGASLQQAVASSTVVPATVSNAAAAQAQAQAAFVATQQTAVLLTIDVVGNPNVLSKTVVMISGLGKRLSGRYHISEVTHKIEANSYTMKAKVRTDGTNLHTAPAATKSAASPNTQNPDAAGDGSLTPIDTVDHASGEAHTEYKDLRGGGK